MNFLKTEGIHVFFYLLLDLVHASLESNTWSISQGIPSYATLEQSCGDWALAFVFSLVSPCDFEEQALLLDFHNLFLVIFDLLLFLPS